MAKGFYKGRSEKEVKEFDERVIEIKRVSRVVKGGRRIRFRVLIVIGDKKGKIGYGIAKGNEITVAIQKAVTKAKKDMITVPVINGTIPYELNTELGSSKIFMKPASQGTSVVAGGVIRVIAELAGIHDLLSKVIGSPNKVNNVKVTFKALSSFDPEIVEKAKKRAEAKEKLIAAKEIKVEKKDIKDIKTDEVITNSKLPQTSADKTKKIKTTKKPVKTAKK